MKESERPSCSGLFVTLHLILCRDFAGKDFDKAKPVMQLEGQDNPEFTHEELQLAPPLKLKAFNHVGGSRHFLGGTAASKAGGLSRLPC